MAAKKKQNENVSKIKSALPGDVIRVTNVTGGSAVAAGRGASANVSAISEPSALNRWLIDMQTKIASHSELSEDEKQDAKEQVVKIADEAAKGKSANLNRLEKLINTLALMGTDIFEVAIATLTNPLAGVGLTIKKIADKAKLETESNKDK